MREARVSIKEWIGAFVFSLVFAAINLIDLITYFVKKPPNTIYLGITHWYEDFFYYLSTFAQGASNSWLVQNLFTSEDIPATLNWSFNLLLGKLGGLLGLAPWTTYHISLIAFSLAYILLVFVALTYIYPQSRLHRWTAYLVAIISSGPVTFFYSYTTPLNRLGGVPHLIAQNILALLALLVYSSILTKTSSRGLLLKKSFLLAGVMAVLFIINPVYVLTTLAAIVIASLFYRSRHLIIPLGLLAIVLVPLVVYQLRVFSHPFYQYFRLWEASVPPIPFFTLIRSYGLIIFFAAFGLPFFLKQKTPLRILGVTYAIAPIVAYYAGVPKLLTLPYFRFLEPPAYVFFGALAAEGLFHIARGKKLFLLLGAVYIITQLPGLYREANQKTNYYYLNSHLNYVPRDLWDGISRIQTLPDNGVVLASGTLELFVPFLTGRTVYSAHRSLTLDYERKVNNVQQFYSGSLPPKDAQDFLTGNRITLIVWPHDFGNAAYPFLKLLFTNTSLSIYTP